MITSYFGKHSGELEESFKFLDIDHVLVEQSIGNLSMPNQYSRLTLRESDLSLNRLKKEVAQYRRNYHLVVVEPKTAGGASFAVRDNRVDMIRLNLDLGLHTFNKKYAKRLVEFDKFIEIDLSIFFRRTLARDLRRLSRILETFEGSDIKFHLTNLPSHPVQLRSVRGLQSFGRLLGLSNKQSDAKLMIERIERNIKKIEGKIPFPGVEISGSQD